MDNVQQQVMDAVVACGYRGDWSASEFLALQMLKLIEELAEALRHFKPSPIPIPWSGRYAWGLSFDSLARACREVFDQAGPEYWKGLILEHPGKLRDELADMQVVLFCAAAALGEIIGPFDLVELALEKARSDVEQGVR